MALLLDSTREDASLTGEVGLLMLMTISNALRHTVYLGAQDWSRRAFSRAGIGVECEFVSAVATAALLGGR
jgi:hypothetical protein